MLGQILIQTAVVSGRLSWQSSTELACAITIKNVEVGVNQKEKDDFILMTLH